MRLPTGLAGISAGGSRLARALLERAIDDALDVGDDERLADVVERAGAHRFDRGLQRAEPADQHDRAALFGLEPAQQVEARARRVQVDVRDQQIERVVADLRQRACRDPAPTRTAGPALRAAPRGTCRSPRRRRPRGCEAWLGRAPLGARPAGRSMTNTRADGLVRRGDRAAVRPHHVAHDGEAEAAAVPDRLGRHPRIEQAVDDLGRNARTRVGDLDADPVRTRPSRRSTACRRRASRRARW